MRRSCRFLLPTLFPGLEMPCGERAVVLDDEDEALCLVHRKNFRRSVRPGLTGREAQVLAMIEQGLQNKEIASKLNVSVRTVKYYASNVYAKGRIRGRHELLAALAARPDSTGAWRERQS